MRNQPAAVRCPARALLRNLVIVTTLSATCCAASIGAAGTASASSGLLASCRVRPTSTPFAPWGDDNSYFAMRGGSFESGSPGWTLAGAGVVAGNESYFVNRPTDAESLALPEGAEATSPRTCVAMGEETVRFFAESSGDPDSTLHVQASVRDPLTGLVLSTGYDISAGSGAWAPSDQLLIPNLLGGVLGTQQLTLTFTTTGTGTWNIDDVYVDPFKSH